ncbi:MAG: DUF6636 domain-containing protein [Solirubrobacterales bacterium]
MRRWPVPGAPCTAGFGVALTLLVLAGCGGSTATVIEERTVTEAAPAGTGEAGDEEGGGAGSGGTGGETTGAAESEAPAEFLELDSFQSPSGNIGCVMIEGEARCDAAKHSWAAPRPEGCPEGIDAGQGLQVDASGAASVVCAGDTTLSTAAPVLEYGTASESGGTLCVSRRSSVTCTNADGHGFTISAQAYELF